MFNFEFLIERQNWFVEYKSRITSYFKWSVIRNFSGIINIYIAYQMKKILFTLTFLTFLISCNEELNLGNGFYLKSIRTENPPDFFEKYCYSTDLYFNNYRIDEASSVNISTSGRYAVFGSSTVGGIILFDNTNYKKYRVANGISPNVFSWDTRNNMFFMSYFENGNQSKIDTIIIRNLNEIISE